MSQLGPTLIKLIDFRISRAEDEIIATVVQAAYQHFDQDLNAWLWVLDVDLSQDENRPDQGNIVRAVAISDPSHYVHRVAIGNKVRLRKTGNMKWEAVSTTNFVTGQVAVTTVIFLDVGVTINPTVTFGSTYRMLTYDELGDATFNGGFAYGSLPYGMYGKFNADDDLIYLISPTT